MRNTRRIYDELCAYDHDEDAAITESMEVFSIDPGAHFIDDAKQYHHGACFWLSVHCALHFAANHNRLPLDLTKALHRHELLPAILKAKSGCHSLTARADERRHIEPLCRFLGIRIVVYVKGKPQVYGCNDRFTITLWLSQCHYTVLVCRKGYSSNRAVTQATKFASDFAEFGYKADYLKPAQNERDDYTVALALNREAVEQERIKQNQILADAELARQLQLADECNR